MDWLRRWLVRDVEWRLDTLTLARREDRDAVLTAIKDTKETLMAGVAELQQAIDDVKAAAAAEADRVEAVIAALKALPQSPDLSAQVAELQSIKGNLDAVEQTPAPTP